MAYPKPLSKKTIDKMYLDSGLTEEKITFLRRLFDGAAALYGVITLDNLLNVYREYASKIPAVRIHRKDIYNFSSIARREVHDYYVYEVDELYKEEQREDKYRYIIFHEIMDFIPNDAFYKIEELANKHSFYVPDNLLSLKGHVKSEAEDKLYNYIENIKANSPVLRNRFLKEKTKPSPHQGKKLKDFTFLSDNEQFQLDWESGKIEGGPKKPQEHKLKKFWNFLGGSMAEKLFRIIRFNLFSGRLSLTYIINIVMGSLEEAGVVMSEKEFKKFISLLQEFNNNSHLYINRGWTPKELSQDMYRDYKGPTTLSLGPGIMKSINEGKIDFDELKAKAREMGINIEIN